MTIDGDDKDNNYDVIMMRAIRMMIVKHIVFISLSGLPAIHQHHSVQIELSLEGDR